MSEPLPPAGDERYRALIAREAAFWGRADADPENPQLWDDPGLFRLTLEPAYRHLLARARAAGGRALELGCGDGDLAADLAREGLDVTGVDLAPERVARARATAERLGLAARLRFEVADLNVAALPEAAYDVVVAHDALHHLPALDHVLDQVRRTLVPGGTLLVSDFIGAGWLEKAACALALGVLPTHLPYAKKWRLRRRVTATLAREADKREALAGAGGAALHDASPFEGITQASLEPAIAARFRIVERFTFCPYWYHAFVKLRLPLAARRRWLAAWRPLDAWLHAHGWTRGSYLFVEAKRDAG